MATERQRPYLRHNFLVDITDLNDAQQDSGGFQEVTGLGIEIAMAEYRNGNNAFNYPIKIMGLSKVPDVTLKRGVLGSLALYEWIRAVQVGEPDQLKTVTITLLGEDRTTQAQVWKLSNARPLKYTGPPLSGTAGGEVAIQELTLGIERLEEL